MQGLDLESVFSELCRKNQKWGIALMYFTGSYEKSFCTKHGIDQYSWETVQRSVPMLDADQCIQLVSDQKFYVLFDTEDEARNFYESIYGDESEMEFFDRLTVRASLYDSAGGCVTENS
jgi:hypothetical protein